MNELTVQKRAPEVIVAEIWTLNRFQLVNWIETGRKLCELKESVPYGEFGKWVKEAGYSTTKANNLMRLYTEFGAAQGNLFGTDVEDFQTYGKLQYSQAVALLEVPAEERAEFMATHNVEDMSVRELQKAIRERDEAKKAAADFEEDNKELAAKLRQKEARVKELEERPVDVAVQVDEAAIQKAADEARAAADAAWSAKVKEAEDKLAKAQEKAKKAAEKAKKAAEKAKSAEEDAGRASAAELDAAKKAEQDARAEADRLRAELEAAKKEATASAVASDADFMQCVTLANQIKSFANQIVGIRDKALSMGDETKAEKLKKLILRIADDVRGCA